MKIINFYSALFVLALVFTIFDPAHAIPRREVRPTEGFSVKNVTKTETESTKTQLVLATGTIPVPSTEEYEHERNSTKEFIGGALPQRPRSLIWITKNKNGSVLRLVASSAGFPNLRLDYFTKKHNASDSDESQVADFSFRFGVLGLIEIVNDTALPATLTPFTGSNKWNPAQLGQITPQDNSSLVIRTATLSSKVNAWPVIQPNLSVSLTLYGIPQLLAMGNQTFTPGSIKFDLQVDNYNYQRNDTALGVVTALWTKNTTANIITNQGCGVTISRQGLGAIDWTNVISTNKGDGRLVLLANNVTTSSLVATTSREDDPVIKAIVNNSTDGDREDDKSNRVGEVSSRLIFKVVDAVRPTSFVWDPNMSMDVVGLDTIASNVTDLSTALVDPVVAIATVGQPNTGTTSGSQRVKVAIMVIALVACFI